MMYAVVCVSQSAFPKGFLSSLSEAMGKLKLKPGQLAESTRGPFNVIHLKATAATEITAPRIKTVLAPLAESHRLDILCLPDEQYRTPKKLIAFDMDSTLIQSEVIDEMATIYGVGAQVKKVTERAMNGEMDFDQSLRERLGLLKGLRREKLDELFQRIRFTAGTEAFVQMAHQQGIKTAIVSGGFTYFAEKFRQQLGMNYAFANELEFDADTLTGTVRGDILNAQKKVEIVQSLAAREGIPMEQVAAVGDGANDLPMLASVGLGVAIHGKARVRQEAQHLINHGPMTTLSFYLGMSYGDV